MNEKNAVISVNFQLEKSIAKFLKENVGKGPNFIEVRIYKDIVICLFEGILTKAELAAVETGYLSEVCKIREIFENQKLKEIENLVQMALNRKIKSFFTSLIPLHNQACWTIVLD